MTFGLEYPEHEGLQHTEVEGVWQIVFTTFVVYSMLPLRSISITAEMQKYLQDIDFNASNAIIG